MIEFSTLRTAIKPKDQSDKYLILSALYVLQAHTLPVTTKQVNDLLELHLKSKTPTNTAASLNAYKAYVTPIDSHPRKWSLTEKGLQHLRELSTLELPSKVETKFESDIGIICALEDPEFAAVYEAFGGKQKWKDIGDGRLTHIYRETNLETYDKAQLRVVATTATSMGLTASAIATTQLIMQFKPKLVVAIGIAAGTKKGGKEFGDVLVADPSIDYNSGKVVLSKGIREFEPDPYPINLNPRIRSILKKNQREETLFDEIRKKWGGKLPLGRNRLHVGPVGAADQVIDDPTRIVEIQKNWRKLIGVEMETYSVYRSVNEAPEPKPRVISFKAVCDFAEEKSDSWQNYAAFVAAEFSIEFFKREWRGLWPPSSD